MLIKPSIKKYATSSAERTVIADISRHSPRVATILKTIGIPEPLALWLCLLT